MKLAILVESDFVADSATEFDVPDGSTPEQINEVVEKMLKSRAVSWPSPVEGTRVATTLQVFFLDEDGDVDAERTLENCERNW